MRKFAAIALMTLAPTIASASYTETHLRCHMHEGSKVTAFVTTEYRGVGIVTINGKMYSGQSNARINKINLQRLIHKGQKGFDSVVIRRDDLSIAIFDNGKLFDAGVCHIESSKRVRNKF